MWTTRLDLTLREIADHFRASPGTISGIIRRAQRVEGFERWPKRTGPIKPRETPRPPPRLKAGAATLPPLDSLK